MLQDHSSQPYGIVRERKDRAGWSREIIPTWESTRQVRHRGRERNIYVENVNRRTTII